MRKRDGSGWTLTETIPVLEIFGPTIQGEGMVAGRKTMFVRTAGCDYACSWCDSAFTWDGSAKDEIVQMNKDAIWQALNEEAEGLFSHVTISGGNPALLKNLGSFITLLKEKAIDVALETQGSVWQDWFTTIDDLTISPKPPSSRMETDFGVLDDIMTRLREAGRSSQVSLKVVIFDEEDLAYARRVKTRYPDVPFYLQVGNDDTVTDEDKTLRDHLMDRYEWLINETMGDAAFNDAYVLPQIHALLWGNRRGV
ncbi:7-carboxy-7-deazaguanine synthase QueE [Salisediminibacterium selenitireducens]|uniref:7-carboxy-7-deazaguanine synthase QueE n=1 Tax=Salisediminibacterium selenitireducens TaxID=85683 RepID=UPI000674AB8A